MSIIILAKCHLLKEKNTQLYLMKIKTATLKTSCDRNYLLSDVKAQHIKGYLTSKTSQLKTHMNSIIQTIE